MPPGLRIRAKLEGDSEAIRGVNAMLTGLMQSMSSAA